MRDTITLVGTIGTVPALQTSDDGRPFLNFRLATNHSWQNKETHEFVEGEPNWFTVKAFRSLAVNVHASVSKGQRIIVTGRLSVRRWESGEKSGTQVEVMADHIGHDLALGTARYSRMSTQEATRPATVEDGPSGVTANQDGTYDDGARHDGPASSGADTAGPASSGADTAGPASSGADTAGPETGSVTNLTGHEVVDEPGEPANAPF